MIIQNWEEEFLKPDYKSIHAIAVEDDEGSALLIQAILRRIGIDIHVHSTGDNLLQFIHALPTPPNLILLDIHLPRQNGLDLVKQLRSDPQFADVLAVAVSASDPNDYIPKAKEAGFNSFLRKPINRTRFPKQIERILAGESIWEMH